MRAVAYSLQLFARSEGISIAVSVHLEVSSISVLCSSLTSGYAQSFRQMFTRVDCLLVVIVFWWFTLQKKQSVRDQRTVTGRNDCRTWLVSISQIIQLLSVMVHSVCYGWCPGQTFDLLTSKSSRIAHAHRVWTLCCFLPARRYARAVLCDSDMSVRLSVCPSVTRRYCA